MVDHQATAQQVWDHHCETFDERTDYAQSKGDIVYVGRGYSRITYRVGDWVYKFEYRSHAYGMNQNEINAYERVCRKGLPEGFAVPETLGVPLSDGTLAVVMQFIEGSRPHAAYAVTDMFWNDYGIGDAYSHNMLKDSSGTVWLFDLGESYE